MKFLVDIGNTRLKWALWDGAALAHAGALPHAGGDVDFASLWKNIPNVAPASAWIASVAAPALAAALARALAARFGIEARFVRSSASACGVRNAYAQPERLGVDRFLGLVAAHAEVPGPVVVAGCGTALTIDALAADGEHIGGLIAPSPALMRSALTAGTARLGDLREGSVVDFAADTAAAVESGVWLAAVALVERFHARAAARWGSPPALLLTGGGADRLAALIALPHRADRDLVLRGLARYADAAS